MDYSIWAEIEKRLSNQERSYPASKKETRDEYLQRARRTAMRLPAAFINRAIGDMKRRCQLLFEAKGGLFEEGGQRRRA